MTKPVVAVAQMSMPSADLAESVATHVRLAGEAADQGAQLVVFPELSLTGYRRDLRVRDALAPEDPRLAPLQGVADGRALVIVAGAPLASLHGLHIGALGFRPADPVLSYTKRYLGRGEESAFVPGDGGRMFPLADQQVALAICAEINRPEHARTAAAAGATIYAAGCLLGIAGYEQDATRLRGHAARHRMLTVMANYAPPVPEWHAAGRSAAWSPDGVRLAVAPAEGEAVIVVERTSGGWRARRSDRGGSAPAP